MSALAVTLLAISILILAAVMLYIGRSIAKCVEINKAASDFHPSGTVLTQARGEGARQQSVSVWTAIYTQSTALHSGITKYLSTVILAVLGIAATLIANKVIYLGDPVGLTTNYLLASDPAPLITSKLLATWSVIFLFFALVLVIGPAELLAYKQRDLADELSTSFNRDPLAPTFLPKCRLPAKYFFFHLGPYLLLIFGAGFLVMAVSTTP